MLTIGFYGNCQAVAMAKILETHEQFCKKYNVIFKVAAWNVEDDQIDEMYENIKNIDILITHYVNESFRDNIRLGTMKMISHMKPGSKVIFIPNCHFRAYFPACFYMKNIYGEKVFKCGIEYFDKDIFQGYVNGESVDSLCERLSSDDFYSKEYIEKIAKQDIIELRKRYTAIYDEYASSKFAYTIECINIPIHDYIESNYNKRRLFFTLNHPTNELLYRIVDLLCDKLFIGPMINTKTDPYLFTTIFAIPKSIQLAMNIRDDTSYYMKGKKYTLKECIDMYYYLFKNEIKDETIEHTNKILENL